RCPVGVASRAPVETGFVRADPQELAAAAVPPLAPSRARARRTSEPSMNEVSSPSPPVEAPGSELRHTAQQLITGEVEQEVGGRLPPHGREIDLQDRKSTRLNSSHVAI